MPEINLNTIPGIVKAVRELQTAVQALERRMSGPTTRPASETAPKAVLAAPGESLEPMLTTTGLEESLDTAVEPRRRGRPRREGADYG